ncbi:MAG: hypothetical protein IJT16_13525 [Lachnospiraceae bacterium]|nr:hypothetical protein [Lachnospiraceae bacterium]
MWPLLVGELLFIGKSTVDGREILLVGISYDKDAPGGDKKHTCRIIHLFAKGFFNE